MAEMVAAVAAVASVSLKLAEILSKAGANWNGLKSDANFKTDVKRVTEELRYMEAFLKEAETKPGRNNYVFKEWVYDVKQMADECEDVMDALLLEFDEKNAKAGGRRIGLLSKLSTSYKTGLNRTHKLSVQLKQILSDILDISERKNRYDLSVDTSRNDDSDIRLRERRRTAPHAYGERMIGLGDTICLLKSELEYGRSGKFVLSILGMGGLGKTTLARNLYNNLPHGKFDCYAWICVSEKYNIGDILLKLINSMTNPTKEDLERLTSNDLKEEYLFKGLSNRCFLVVLDDLWETDVWESLKRAFPDENKGSRVILTTRNVHVAQQLNAYVHELRYLSEYESWELFRLKASCHAFTTPHSELEKIGKEMVTQCKGLPLAIVTLGGILSTKSNIIEEWEEVRNNLWRELKNDFDINAILTLSFNDLPYYLKPCFLYAAMFPEDIEIPTSKLMMLWEGESFLSHFGEECIRDVAKQYFDELVGRCLFSKAEGDWFDSTFRVHDLLRDLAIRKARDLSFWQYYDGKETYNLSKARSHKRLSVFTRGIPHGYTNLYLRTLCLPDMENTTQRHNRLPTSYISSQELSCNLKGLFSSLRVLDIQIPLSIVQVSNNIDRLVYLRYLGIRLGGDHDGLLRLPDTIGNLKALQTICIKSHDQVILPETVWKLKKLKHLIGNFSVGRGPRDSVCLETLTGIQYEEWGCIDTNNLGNIRRLLLTEISGEHGDYDDFGHLSELRELSLLSSRTGLVTFRKIFQDCPNITHFTTTVMSFSSFAGMHAYTDKLQVLNLEFSDYEPEKTDEVLSSIGMLPRLRALRLLCSKSGMILVFPVGEFFELRSLTFLTYFSGKLVVEDGCMPYLEHFVVSELVELKVSGTLMDLIAKV